MKLCRVFVKIYIYIYSPYHHHYRRRRRFINIEIPIPTYQKHFCIEKLIQKHSHTRTETKHTRIHIQTKTHTTTKPTHNIAYIYMIAYKETRDIVSIKENRQLQTGTSAEVLSATSKNHLYKIKLNKKTKKKKNTKKLRLYLKQKKIGKKNRKKI